MFIFVKMCEIQISGHVFVYCDNSWKMKTNQLVFALCIAKTLLPTSIVIFIATALVTTHISTCNCTKRIRSTSGKLNGGIVNVNNLLAILMDCPVTKAFLSHWLIVDARFYANKLPHHIRIQCIFTWSRVQHHKHFNLQSNCFYIRFLQVICIHSKCVAFLERKKNRFLKTLRTSKLRTVLHGVLCLSLGIKIIASHQRKSFPQQKYYFFYGR